MSLNFAQLCESVFSDLNILEEADKSVLDGLSRQAYKAHLRKESAKTPEEADRQVQELFRLRTAYIREIRTPGLYASPEQRQRIQAMTEQDVENFIKNKAANEMSEQPKVHGTHFLTMDYLSEYTGTNK